MFLGLFYFLWSFDIPVKALQNELIMLIFENIPLPQTFDLLKEVTVVMSPNKEMGSYQDGNIHPVLCAPSPLYNSLRSDELYC